MSEPVGSNAPERPAKRLGGVTGKGFQPGQSGNPSGKPKALAAVQEAARAKGLEAIEGLYALATDENQPGAVRKAAWDSLLDRGFGKPTQSLDVNDARPLASVSADVLLMAVQRLTVAAAEPDGLEGRGRDGC